ncbi:hypothetical protein LCGC14_2407950, partial [marine sediment metagenome]
TFVTGIRIIGAVSEWSEKALADGKVTITEAVEIAEKIGSLLGVRLELDIPGVVIKEPELDSEEEKPDPDRTKMSWERDQDQ